MILHYQFTFKETKDIQINVFLKIRNVVKDNQGMHKRQNTFSNITEWLK
jgi:hypothetical protein